MESVVIDNICVYVVMLRWQYNPYNIFNNQMSYNFKAVKVIPPASEMINIVLSKTQRKTPTVIHPGYAISRIRSFYMRKVILITFRSSSARIASPKDWQTSSTISPKLRTSTPSTEISSMFFMIRTITSWPSAT
jgi:hypothetical protein